MAQVENDGNKDENPGSSHTPAQKILEDIDFKVISFFKVVNDLKRNLTIGDLLQENETLFTEIKQNLKNGKDERLVEFDKRLADEQADLDISLEKLLEASELRKEHEADFEELKKVLEELKTRYLKLNDELGKKQSRPLKRFINETQDDLNDLIDNHLNTLNKKFNLKELNLDEVLAERLRFLENTRDTLKQSHDKIRKKVERLLEIGRTITSSHFLITIGLASSAASGWFFTYFIQENQIALENPLLFVFTDIYRFVFEFFSFAGGSKLWGGMLAIVAGMLLLLIITVVIWLVEATLNRLGEDSTQAQFSYQKIEKAGTFDLQINGDRFYSFWLQLIPWILIFWVSFVLISIGHPDDSKNFGALITGQSIGSIITLLCAGFTLVYITKIIEPRIERNPTNKTWKHYAEVIIALVTFVLVMMILTFWQPLFNGLTGGKAVLLILLFLGCTLLSSVSIAYGIRDRNTFNSFLKIDKRLFTLVMLIDRYRKGLPLDYALSEHQNFSKRVFKVQKELLDLIEDKNRWDKVRSPNPSSILSKGLFGFFNRLFKPKLEKELTTVFADISAFERRYFPELVYEMDGLKSEIIQTESKIKQVKALILEFKDESNPLVSKRKEEVENSKTNKKELLLSKEEEVQKLRDRLKELKDIKMRVEMEIQKGFNLGHWWLQNKQNYGK